MAALTALPAAWTIYGCPTTAQVRLVRCHSVHLPCMHAGHNTSKDTIMNSNQRSEGNNQTSNGGNEKSVSSSRAGVVEKDNMHPDNPGSGTLNSGTPDVISQSSQSAQNTQSSGSGSGSGTGSHVGQDSTERNGSQTGSEQQGQAAQRQSNDAAGGYPRSPGGANQLAGDEKMDDDTGFSSRPNRQAPLDEGSKQEAQSNVGRRSDMTPD